MIAVRHCARATESWREGDEDGEEDDDDDETGEDAVVDGEVNVTLLA